MSSLSVIMPTMWRSKRTESLLEMICESDDVSEVIIIDNDKESRPNIDFNSKVVLLEQEENIFVNPAWNLGVEKSKEDYLCIINDDISISCDNLFKAMLQVLKHIPCVGVHPNSYEYEDEDLALVAGHAIGRGWGCCIFLDKSKWVPIPDDLKIWFGDNWIVKNYKDCASFLYPVRTEMSTTSNADELKDVIKKDIETWEKLSI